MACSNRSTCQLFRIFASKPSLRVWSEWYCDGDHARCARVRRASLGEDVPRWLLPNGQSLEGPSDVPPARC